MGKRGNENAQQSKEDWEAAEANELSAGGGGVPSGGFSRAGEEQLRRRKIVRVSRDRWKTPGASAPSSSSSGSGGGGRSMGVSAGNGGGGGGFRPPPSASASAPPMKRPKAAGGGGGGGGSNPFAAVNLAGGGGGGKKSNPFAGVTFAAPAPAPAATSSNPFPSAPAAAAPPANGGGAGVRPSSSQSLRLFGDPPVRSDYRLNLDFLDMVRNEAKGSPMSDWSGWMGQYLKYAERVTNELLGGDDDEEEEGGSRGGGGGSNGGKNVAASVAPAPVPPPPAAAPPAAAPAAAPPAFSFGQPPPKEAPKPFSFGGGAPPPAPAASPAAAAGANKPAGFNFSFGGAPPPSSSGGTTAAAPKPTGLFGAPAPAAQAAPAATVALGAQNGNNDTNNDDNADDVPTKVAESADADQEVLHAVRAKYFKYEDDGWKGYAAGPLRCYKSKSDPTKRKIVLRNGTGKVLLNLAVSNGMEFQKQAMPKKGKGQIRFVAVADENAGPERFALAVRAENLDGLHEVLEKMAKI